MTWVHFVNRTVIPKGTSLLIHALPRYEPMEPINFIAWNPINEQTRIEPLLNMNPNLTQGPLYVWTDADTYWDYYYFVDDAFDCDLRYPMTSWSYKIYNLLAPITNRAYPSYFWLYLGNATSCGWNKDKPNYNNLVEISKNPWVEVLLENASWIGRTPNNPYYSDVPLLEKDYNVSLESSELRANALTNLTFRFNTCIPLFPWQLNVTWKPMTPHALKGILALEGTWI